MHGSFGGTHGCEASVAQGAGADGSFLCDGTGISGSCTPMKAARRYRRSNCSKNKRRITAGEDKTYDTEGHVADLRGANITPHVAQNLNRNGGSAIDARTTRPDGYAMSQTCCKMIECIFEWGKQHGTMRKAKMRGIPNVATVFMFNVIGYTSSASLNCWLGRDRLPHKQNNAAIPQRNAAPYTKKLRKYPIQRKFTSKNGVFQQTANPNLTKVPGWSYGVKRLSYFQVLLEMGPSESTN